METKLKDVLHFYIGCPLNNGGTLEAHYFLFGNLKQIESGKVKPILRRLSSMTEEEAQTYSKQTVESLVDSQDLKTHVFCPALEDVPKLLKARYDLFNLIDTNQAIEKP